MSHEWNPGQSKSNISFEGLEYQSDDSIRPAFYEMRGSVEAGWRITRDGEEHLTLGAGYELLRCECCGVCSTDLDRRFLPFPLPQIIGHELVATNRSGRRHVVEINASHEARGLPASGCEFCQSGLFTHCPERLVLGIHDLPGGFGPWILAPRRALLPLPDAIPDDVAVLIEPFAAALHAAETVGVRDGDRIAVLGTRRLGLLVVAALAARKRRGDFRGEIVGLSRHESLRQRALRFGADSAHRPDLKSTAEVVIDTTGTSEGLEVALTLATREVHLKSTHGQAAAGLGRVTEFVVDEISLESWRESDGQMAGRVEKAAYREDMRPLVAWISKGTPPDWLSEIADLVRAPTPLQALRQVENFSTRLPRVDVAVVDDPRLIDEILRPIPGQERGLVRPRGTIFFHGDGADGPLLRAVAIRGLRLSSSRCGDFRRALTLLQNDAELLSRLPELITHRFPVNQLQQGMQRARSRDCIKVVIQHATPEGRHDEE